MFPKTPETDKTEQSATPENTKENEYLRRENELLREQLERERQYHDSRRCEKERASTRPAYLNDNPPATLLGENSRSQTARPRSGQGETERTKAGSLVLIKGARLVVSASRKRRAPLRGQKTTAARRGSATGSGRVVELEKWKAQIKLTAFNRHLCVYAVIDQSKRYKNWEVP